MSSITDLETHLKLQADLSLAAQEPLASRTTLRIGGPAELLARVRTEAALGYLVDGAAQHEVPYRVLGLGSNVLVPDEGLAGVTVILEGEFLEMSFCDGTVDAGAGLPLAKVARAAVERGLAGLEALAGFPSTVGGAVIMNAGCYGVEIKDILEKATWVRPGSIRQILTIEDLAPRYRSTSLQGRDGVVTRAVFRLQPDTEGRASERLQELNRRRRQSMPSGRPNAGSVFKNPANDFAGRLIEECGLKGARQGGAEVSPAHANVIVNNGDATAEDVLELMGRIHRAVADRFAVSLEPELILCGSLGRRWPRIVAES